MKLLKSSKNGFGKYFYLVLMLCLSFALVLAGCSNSTSSSSKDSATSQGSKTGGTLKIALTNDVVNIGLGWEVRTPQEIIVGSTAMETMGRYDANGKINPWLADSWTVDSAAKTITIKLKKGIKFQDGTDFNAEAVKWNLEQYQQSHKAVLNDKDVASITAVDDSTVKITMNVLNSGILTQALTVEMASPTAYEKNGRDWAIKNPVGTGPYKFVSWEKSVSVKFTKNKNYWQKGKPYLDGVEWKIIPEPMTAEASFKTGDVDVIFAATADVAKDLESSYPVQKLLTGLGASGGGLIGDSSNPKSPFSNVKVRQALGYAIDREAIAKTVFSGYVIPTNQWAIPGTWGYNKNVENQYNPKKAKELLAEAGYANGLKTTITFVNKPDMQALYTAVQGYLQKVGIDAKLVPVDNAKFQQLTLSKWDGLINFGFNATDATQNMGRSLGDTGSLYVNNITHPDDLVQAFAQAATISDIEAKKAPAAELEKMAFDDYAMATMFYINTMPTVKQKAVQDDGFSKTNGAYWTPEAAWIKK